MRRKEIKERKKADCCFEINQAVRRLNDRRENRKTEGRPKLGKPAISKPSSQTRLYVANTRLLKTHYFPFNLISSHVSTELCEIPNPNYSTPPVVTIGASQTSGQTGFLELNHTLERKTTRPPAPCVSSGHHSPRSIPMADLETASSASRLLQDPEEASGSGSLEWKGSKGGTHGAAQSGSVVRARMKQSAWRIERQCMYQVSLMQ